MDGVGENGDDLLLIESAREGCLASLRKLVSWGKFSSGKFPSRFPGKMTESIGSDDLTTEETESWVRRFDCGIQLGF